MKNRWFAGRWQLMCLVIYFQFSINVFAQDSAYVNSPDSLSKALQGSLIYVDPVKQYTYNKKRVKLVTAGNIIGYSGTMVGLYSAWYSKYPQTSFHTFNDNREWLQVDKVGHAYSAYAESYGSMEMWRWTGISRKQRIILGGLSGAAYQTVIEILDGFSEGWGWSWGDFGANILGSGLLAGQELAWDEQRIRFKFSFHKKKYGSAELTARANELFGESTGERF